MTSQNVSESSSYHGTSNQDVTCREFETGLLPLTKITIKTVNFSFHLRHSDH